MATEGDGRFAFDRLPPGKYWVTVRRPNLPEDTAIFRSVNLTVAEPAGSIEFFFYPNDFTNPTNSFISRSYFTSLTVRSVGSARPELISSI